MYLFLGLLLFAAIVFIILGVISEEEYERHDNFKKARGMFIGIINFYILNIIFGFFNVPFKSEMDKGMAYFGVMLLDLSLVIAILFFIIGVWDLLKNNKYKHIMTSGISLGAFGTIFITFKLLGLF